MREPITTDGDHMRMTVDADGNGQVTFHAKPQGRVCGDCQLCCKLVPVAEIDKPAGIRCQHQRHGKGCAIYVRRPNSCRTWACRWLIDPDAKGLRRPDHAHYVIDIVPDYVVTTDKETGKVTQYPVVQIWVDPKHPDAHKDPALRAYIDANKLAAIIRYSSHEAFVIVPPSAAEDGVWQEHHGKVAARDELERKIMEMAR